MRSWSRFLIYRGRREKQPWGYFSTLPHYLIGWHWWLPPVFMFQCTEIHRWEMVLVPNEGTDLPWVKSRSMQEKDHPWHSTKCFSPLGHHAPNNFLLSKLILRCAVRISCCRVNSGPAPGYLETEVAICIPPLTSKAYMLDRNTN